MNSTMIISNRNVGIKLNNLFRDTDSLAYKIQTENLYKDKNPDVERQFDTSGYTQ